MGQFGLALGTGDSHHGAVRESRGSRHMKVSIIITPKQAVLDPQGKTVQSALEHMGYTGIQDVRVGKYLELEVADTEDRETVRQQLETAAHQFLSNPVIEDYRIEIH